MTGSTDTTATAEDYLALLERSGLLTARQVDKVRRTFDVGPSVTGEDLARQLVRGRVLTPFQAERLLEGRYRGFLIDHYRIREILGVGGMGCVFVAEDGRTREKVAIKVLASQYATDAGMLTRMKLEAWAGMQIDHPNVVRTHCFGSTGAVNYLVMDLLRAITMHEMVALGGPVKPEMACDMFRQAALGLQAAHDRNIIHRDMKPANLLIDHSGHTSVLDFGLALVGDDRASEFSLTMIFGHDCLGTPDYIAPEQSLNSDRVDCRADVYSLGCTMYVALTGRVPFADCQSNSEKLEAQRTRTAPPVQAVNPAVPQEISDIVARMMQRDPEKRFQSAAEVAAALERHARRRPVKFDFRKLITIRAKLARQRELAENRSRPMSRSFITSTLSWVDQPSHHLRAEGDDTFTGKETPAVRQMDPRPGAMPGGGASREVRPAVTSAGKRTVPRGWYVESIRSGRKTPLRTARCRVGTADDADIRVTGRTCDSLQCLLEFDGQDWHLKQESRSFPTFVDGDLRPYTRLRPGARLTFQDGTGFILKHVRNDSDEKVRVPIPLVYLAAAAAAALLAAAAVGGFVWVVLR